MYMAIQTSPSVISQVAFQMLFLQPENRFVAIGVSIQILGNISSGLFMAPWMRQKRNTGAGRCGVTDGPTTITRSGWKNWILKTDGV
jgi:hypothetical protein